MTASEYCHALRLVNAAIVTCSEPRTSVAARRRLRRLAIEAALLRARLGQPAPARQRN